MTTYNTLKKIIPPDQALANQALSRSLRQVKDIFKTDLPTLSTVVSQLESNKDLDLINGLITPLPSVVSTFIANTLATGTGPGNTLTTNDVIGIAAGATVNNSLPVSTSVLIQLDAEGALAPLTANGGSSSSVDNGVYTLMGYALTGAYSNAGNVEDITTIPNTNYYSGPQVFGNVDLAFNTAGTGLIFTANTIIANIATSYSNLSNQSNQSINACASQLTLNVQNCTAAGIDIGNVVSNIANANLISNSVSSVLGFTSQLHDLGLDITEGGTAQFLEAVANTQNLAGQSVVACMREGRNIAVLNAVGIQLDTQLVDVNLNTTVANNLLDGQYTVAEARANIII